MVTSHGLKHLWWVFLLNSQGGEPPNQFPARAGWLARELCKIAEQECQSFVIWNDEEGVRIIFHPGQRVTPLNGVIAHLSLEEFLEELQEETGSPLVRLLQNFDANILVNFELVRQLWCSEHFKA